MSGLQCEPHTGTVGSYSPADEDVNRGVRYALIKKNDIIWEFFPTWGGGSSQIPKLL